MLINLIVLVVLTWCCPSSCSAASLRCGRACPGEQTAEQAAKEWQAQAEAHRASPPTLTPEEQQQVAAYREKLNGVITDDQSDAEVLALMRINPT